MADGSSSWTPQRIAIVGLLFLLSGLAEIGGGWLVWQSVRENKPAWWAVAGGAVLVLYGFIPTLQPLDDFGRCAVRLHRPRRHLRRPHQSRACLGHRRLPRRPARASALLGRVYAVYGGVFIGLSFAWGYSFDGVVPDRGDIVGSLVAFVGVALVLFWPRDEIEQAAAHGQQVALV